MMKTKKEEMIAEAIYRMKLLKVPAKDIQAFIEGVIPVTTFNAQIQHNLDSVHKKALKLFNEQKTSNLIPFAITESWHGFDMVSILYVGEDKEEWEYEREDAKRGISSIFAYNLDCGFGEFGSGIFSIEDGVLWRVA